MAVFSAMQVKSENPSDVLCSPDQIPSASQSPILQTNSLNNNSSTQEMPCLISTTSDKNSPYSLWAEYFDNFPILTEFDLRSGVNSSTGSSIASSSSASCESWSSPGSGSPFSECGADDSPFDDHSVPTSVIDEIVQTLKMDGYNFDHLGEDFMDMQTSQVAVKQEQEIIAPTCYLQNPVYTCLNPPKLQQMDVRKYNNMTTMNNNNMNTMNQNNNINIYETNMDGKWCVDNNGNNTQTVPLPPMSISLQQMQPNQLQQHNGDMSHLSQHLPSLHPQNLHSSHHHHQQQMVCQQPQQQQQMSYTPNSHLDIITTSSQYSNPVFPGTYHISPPMKIESYKYMDEKSPGLAQPSQVQVQPVDKPTEPKPRRRRSNNSSNRVEKPHVCKECGAAFKLSANLKQHQVIHTGEKPFSCEICKAMFTRLSSLKTHHRLHTGEKPHICPFCSAAFADRSAMKAHKRIHTGERPYKCQVCSTSFTQLSHLNAHKRTHTGEKPYACGVCNTTFKQLGHLKRHEKSHVCNRL